MRGILYGGLGLLVVVAIAAAIGWAFRIPMATHLLADRLDRAGFPEAEFEITELGWSRIRIQRLSLGGDEAPAVDRVSAHFQPLQLWRGDTRHLEISLMGLSARMEPSAGIMRIAGMPQASGEG